MSMKIANFTIPCNAKAQRKFADSLAIAYGVKRKFLEPRFDYTMRVFGVARKAIAKEMKVDAVTMNTYPFYAPMSVCVYADENGKRSQLFPPWE